jgi:membrane-bound lytic murein transglycosylase D
MIRKQRLALAISAVLLVAGGTGCSTLSGVGDTSTNGSNEKIVVHHISLITSQQLKQPRLVSSLYLDRLEKERRLDAEIYILVNKLGLGKLTKDKPPIQVSTKKKKSYPNIKPVIIKRAIYKNNNNPQNRKITPHKAVATTKLTQPKAPVTPVNLSAFKREVNRLYETKGTVKNIQQTSRNSLWMRIISGYQFSSDTDKELVQKALYRHIRNPKNLNRLFTRSGKYLPFIVQELQLRGMPTELAFLPMVASAYDNSAKTQTDAVGLWQLTSLEGKHLGLRQTHDYDARMDVFASTRVILNKLQRLNRVFKGDWALTLLGYKIGQKTVQQEIINNRLEGKPTDYWQLNLAKKTPSYLPQLLAYREILLRPYAYALTLPTVTMTSQIMQVEVNQSINLHQVAREAGLPVSTLAKLNLNFKRAITNPRWSTKVVLPRRYATRLHQSIRKQSPLVVASYQPQNTVKRYSLVKQTDIKQTSINKNKPKVRLVKHHIEKGDSLYKIALTYGTTVTNIMRLNGMTTTHIKAGKSLKVTLKSSANHTV